MAHTRTCPPAGIFVFDFNRGVRKDPLTFFFPFFFIQFIIPAILTALPPSSNSDPGPHNGPSSPLPTTVRALIFYREKNSAFSFHVESRRIVPTHAATGALSFFRFSCFFGGKQCQISPRRDRTQGPRTNAINSSIRV